MIAQLTSISNISKDTVFKYVFGLALLLISSQVAIPLDPVPIALHPMVILYIGLTCSVSQSFWIISTYLFLGAMGLPVFANFTGGLPVLVGPKAGYLIGFLPSAMVIAWLQQKKSAKTFWRYALYTGIGTVITYTFGILWLEKFVGFEKAISLGLLPFIIPGIVKAFLLSGLLKLTQKKQ